MLLSGKYAFFENFKAEIQNLIVKKKATNDAHQAYLKKLFINIGHMESQTALETFRQIPNARMQKVYQNKDENN